MPSSRNDSRGSAKRVCFELLLRDAASQTARLPMRVDIYSHDSTDSIIATVKNFFGLYDGNGIIFQDGQGTTIIGRYENFADKQTVYVRVVDNVPTQLSPRRPRLGSAFELTAPNSIMAAAASIPRPSSGAAKKRSISPASNSGHRSHSVSTNKSRAKRSRVGSVHGDNEFDSDSDGGNASVTSSRRAKTDIVAPADISVDNILEGGRRKRARFDSSVSVFNLFIFVI
jgi:hypothetical protein